MKFVVYCPTNKTIILTRSYQANAVKALIDLIQVRTDEVKKTIKKYGGDMVPNWLVLELTRAVEYQICSLEEYDAKIRTTKKVKNLMTGVEIEIDVNTPRCCDPSSESYWSM